jgi:hypothetical protein
MQGTVVVSPDDWRAAANIAISLSEYLITVALAVIAGQAGLATVFVDKRSKLGPYYLFSLVALLTLVASIVLGGRGIADVYHGGFSAHWKDNAVAAQDFNRQAVLLLVGFIAALISVALAFMFGKPVIATASALSTAAIPAVQPTGHRTYLMSTSLIFGVIALLHLLRLAFGWVSTVGGWLVPMWGSWVALLIAAYFAYKGFRLSR